MASRGRPRYPDILTPREWEALELLRAGLSNPQIAERLGIAERTAKFHVSEILGKLGLENREQAAAWRPSQQRRWWTAVPSAIRWGIIAKIAAVAILAVTAVGIAALAYGLLRTEREADSVDANFEPTALKTQARGVAYDGRLEMLLQIDKPLYSTREPVQMKLTVRNISAAPLTLYFMNEQRYDFVVECRGRNIGAVCLDRPLTAKEKNARRMPGAGKTDGRFVWSWSKDAAFKETRERLTLAPGQSLIYAESWNQNANGEPPYQPSDWQLPRTGGFHSRYFAGAAFLGCIARTTTIEVTPSIDDLACDRLHMGDVVFELVP